MSDKFEGDSLDPNKTRLEPKSLPSRPPSGGRGRPAPTEGPDGFSRQAPTEGMDDSSSYRPSGGGGSSSRSGGGGDSSSPRPNRVAPTVYDTPPPLMAWLAMVEGRRPGTIHRLNDGDTLLGRDGSCDILLDDGRTSGQHAKVKVERARGAEPGEERFFLYDLASSNGTFINGESILKQELFDGDQVRIGQSLLVFKRV